MDEQTHESNNAYKVCCQKSGLIKLVAGLFAVLIIITAVFMLFAALNKLKESRYIGQDVEKKNSITISGLGKIEAKPDIGVVSLGVVSQGATVSPAQIDNTEKMNKIVQAMKDLGIDEKDLKTANYSIYPRYNYESGKQNIIGYEVSQSLEVKIRDLNKASSILGKAAELGANQVGSLSFTFDDPEGLKVEAREKAIKNAREKATTLANQLEVDLVRIINFSESSNGYEPPVYYSTKELGIGGGGATPDVQVGQNEITANVSITYEIQ
ncbi:MAG: hypothetical protein A2174_01320 [Candidatus Portnoybacteria bacterium RBG_13_41_18]|uniref:SIMPL domain-containing protein n=1 Tax=Candidatus Portnoybacteria bacterium RBG_13_41_18 TaxID=1801991 RepID=A0A1G2F758_9BACT|nr:MAG: hypothetical protein A2174_01320 [Candidatus Portnoybacteria bacterium RBG_13_41_18]